MRPAFGMLVAINLAVGVYFGAVPVSIAALSIEQHAPQAASVLLAVSSISGLAASWLYGARRWRSPARLQLPLLCAALTMACLLLSQAGSLQQAGAVLAVAGLLIPPILVLSTVLTEAGVHPGVLTQAMTWLNSASAAGSAIATSAAGYAIDTNGASAGFAVAATAAALMTLLAATSRALYTAVSP